MKRQHYQHVVMEPEWETLFNLCILLLEVIEQIVEWCQSDVSVFVYVCLYVSIVYAYNWCMLINGCLRVIDGCLPMVYTYQ